MGFLAQRELLLTGLRSMVDGMVKSGNSRIPVLAEQLRALVVSWKNVTPADGEAKIELTADDQSTLYLVFLSMLEEVMSNPSRPVETEGSPVGMLLDLSMWAAEKDLLEGAAPMSLLESAFEYETIDGCKHVFHFLQSRVNVLATGLLWESKKSRLAFLRIANGLLRRLSKINDGVICGEILMLIAYVFPLDDPSGQNKTGKTNTTNVTLYEMPPLEDVKVDLSQVVSDAKMEDGENKTPPAPAEEKSKVPSELEFYRTFWGLQQYFVEPSMLKTRFTEFKTALESILEAFEKQPLSSLDALSAQSKDYFPKYLSSSKLMELQLRDPALRRHFLLQCLMLFQSLTPAYCQKLGLTLAVRQTEMIEALKTRASTVLEHTPTDSDARTFAAQVAVVINDNERTWTRWKDEEKCPKMQLPPADISKKVSVAKTEVKEKKSKKDSSEGIPAEMIPGMLEDTYTIAKSKTGKLVMGTAELGRLWSLPPNMEVAADPSRNFSPVFSEFLDQMMSEEQGADDGFGEDARLKNDPVYVWRLLRLMQQNDFGMFLKASGGIKDFCKWMAEERNAPEKAEGDKDKEGLPKNEKAEAGEEEAAKEDAEAEAKKRKREGASEELAKKEKLSSP